MGTLKTNNLMPTTGSTITVHDNMEVKGNLFVTGTLNAKVTDFVVSANTTTLGDAGSDSLTINASSAAIPNNLNFATGTLYLDAHNNRVGMGTTSPTSAAGIARFIEISDASSAGLVLNDTGGRAWNIWSADNKLYYWNSTDGNVLTLSTDKYVGINVTDPDSHLEVFGTGTQLKLSYDGSNASTLAVASDGGLTITSGDGIVAMPGDVTIYDDNNNADTSLSIGTSATERLVIEVLNGSSNKTAEEVHFSTRTASGTADHGAMIFDIDETDIFRIDDGGTETTGLTHTTTLTATSTSTLSGLVTVNTGIVPDAQDGAYLGTSSLQWSDLFLADGAVISFGDDNDVKLTHVADTGLTLSHEATGDAKPIVLKLESKESALVGDDIIGQIDFKAADGNATMNARIAAVAANTISNGVNNTNLSFYVAGAADIEEKMKLTNAGALYLTSSGGDILLRSGGGISAGGSSSTLAFDSSGRLTVSGSTDSSSKTTGALVVNGGVGIAKKLFVGTDLDVDGTTNLDAVDIDGAVQLDNTFTVGANDQGYDVILYGDTAGANLTWDTSTDDLILNGAAGLIAGTAEFTTASAGPLTLTGSSAALYLEDVSAPSTPPPSSGVLYVNSDTLYFKNDSGTAVDLTAAGDITGVTAGVGLSGGGNSGAVTLTLDLSELSDVTPANGDKLATLDSDGSTEQLTTVANLATLFAGTGLTATNSVIAVNATQAITAVSADFAITGDLTVTGGDVTYGNAQDATLGVTATAHDTAGKPLTISAGPTTAGTTNNIAGGNLVLSAGQGKGTGAGGDIIFKTANAGSTGSSLNALATALTISDDLSSTFAGTATFSGNVTIGADGDGTDRIITFGHSTLKSVIGIDDDQDVFAINTDNAFEAANDFEIDASGNVTLGNGGLTTSTSIVAGSSIEATTDLTVTGGDITLGADADGADRTIVFGHSTLKSIMGIDDDQDVFAINTDAAFESVNDLEIDASGNVTLGNGNLSISGGTATVTGDAETTGDVVTVSAAALTTGNALYIDHNDTSTGNALVVGVHYDFDKTGNTGAGTSGSFTGVHIDMDDDGSNNAAGMVEMTGLNIDVTSADTDGALANIGLDVNASGADMNYSMLARGRFIYGGVGSTVDNDTNGDTIGTDELIDGLYFALGRGSSKTDTTATAAQIVAAIPDCQAGDTFQFRYYNVSSNDVTLAGGAEVTMANTNTGSFSIAAGKARVFAFGVTLVSPPRVQMLPLSDAFNHSS